MLARLSPFFPAMVVFVGAVFVAAGGFWASWRQSNFNADLRAKNDEISRLQQENVNAITGADSFAYVGFQIVDTNGQMVNASSMPDDLLLIPVFIHKGKYPLYDVSARFVDIDKPLDLNLAANTYQIGNMAPNLAVVSHISLPHHGKDIDFNIFFSARNGTWTHFLRMLWVGNGWASANKVIRGSEEIYNEVSANFPREKDGSVNWEICPAPAPPSPPQKP